MCDNKIKITTVSLGNESITYKQFEASKQSISLATDDVLMSKHLLNSLTADKTHHRTEHLE